MINVIASIRVRPGKRDNLIDKFKANVPKVRAENGCIDYYPTVDIDAGMSYPPQDLDEDTVTVIEKWETLDSLEAHTKAAHMMSYREAVKDLVESVTIKVLREV